MPNKPFKVTKAKRTKYSRKRLAKSGKDVKAEGEEPASSGKNPAVGQNSSTPKG